MSAAEFSVTGVSSPTLLREVYEGLLVPSFPPAELESFAWLEQGVAEARISVLVAGDDHGPIGVAVTEPLGESGVVLLTYFATDARRRGSGVGSMLYAETLRAVRDRDRPRAVVAEVERPDRHSGSDAYGDPSARLRFYARHGAQALDLPYFQPPLRPEDEALHGMLLLVLWADPELMADQSLPGPELVGPAVESILDSVPADLPEAVALRAAAQRPRVPLVRLEDYRRVTPSR